MKYFKTDGVYDTWRSVIEKQISSQIHMQCEQLISAVLRLPQGAYPHILVLRSAAEESCASSIKSCFLSLNIICHCRWRSLPLPSSAVCNGLFVLFVCFLLSCVFGCARVRWSVTLSFICWGFFNVAWFYACLPVMYRRFNVWYMFTFYVSCMPRCRSTFPFVRIPNWSEGFRLCLWVFVNVCRWCLNTTIDIHVFMIVDYSQCRSLSLHDLSVRARAEKCSRSFEKHSYVLNISADVMQCVVTSRNLTYRNVL